MRSTYASIWLWPNDNVARASRRWVSLLILLSAAGCNRIEVKDPTPDREQSGGFDDTIIDTDDTDAEQPPDGESTPPPGDTDPTRNQPPQFGDVFLYGIEDQPASFSAEAQDDDDDPLIYSVLQPPAHGGLEGSAPHWVYQPEPDFFGEDRVILEVSDGIARSFAVVVIEVAPTPDPPHGTDALASTLEDIPVDLVLDATDPDGDPLQWTVQSPEHGTLVGTPPALTYVPSANHHGSDRFTWSVSDGVHERGPWTVEVEIEAVNDVPVVHPEAWSVDEDTPLGLTVSGDDVDGDALVWEVLGQPAGTLLGDGPAYEYLPAADFHGSDSFTLRAFDGQAWSEPAIWTVDVVPVNDAPRVESAQLEVDEDASVERTLTAVDPDGDALLWELTVPPEQGVVEGELPELRYVPHGDANGDDRFFVRVSDGELWSAEQEITVVIDPVNDAPRLDGGAVQTMEERAVDIPLAGTDVDGDEVLYFMPRPPDSGVAAIVGDRVRYTPPADFFGTVQFDVHASDGQAASAPASFTVEVLPVDDAPVAHEATYALVEDVPRTLVLSGSDADGEITAYELTQPPSHGRLSGTPPSLTYRPDADFHGADTFAFRVGDGGEWSTPATVTLHIAPANDVPVPVIRPWSTDEDADLALTLQATDADGDTLIYQVLSAPQHGEVNGTPPSLVYTPGADQHTDVSIQWRVGDGTVWSAPTSTTIAVNPVNDPPLALPQAVEVDEDTPASVFLRGSDVEQDVLSYVIEEAPVLGTLSGTAPALIYTPHPDAHGSDQLRFSVHDGQASSASVTVEIEVQPLQDAPEPDVVAVTTFEDAATTVVLSAFDADGDALTYVVTELPGNGTLSGAPPTLTYTPDPNVFGSDSFRWSVNDGSGWVEDQVASITILPEDDRPVALGKRVETDEDEPVVVLLEGVDSEGASLAYEILTQPSLGTLSGTAPALTYTPDANRHGQDTLEYRVSDGQQWSDPATVALSVAPVNDRPTASSAGFSTLEEEPVDIELVGIDVDGDDLQVEIVTAPTLGQLTGEGFQRTYVPDPDAFGEDSLRFRVFDGVVWSRVSLVTIDILPVVDEPMPLAQVYTGDEDTTLVVRLLADNPDQGPLSWQVVTRPEHGVLSGVAPDLLFTPDPNWNGTTGFEVLLAGSTADITLEVLPTPDPPVAVPGAWSTELATPVSITLEGSDPDGDALSWTVQRPPQHGEITGSGAVLIYTPDEGFRGMDELAVVADDGTHVSAPVVHTIEVRGTGAPPLVPPAAYAVLAGGTLDVAASYGLLVGAEDPDGTVVVVEVDTVRTALGVTLDLHADGSFQYVVPTNAVQTFDQFPFVVVDEEGDRTTGSATISIGREVWHVDNRFRGDGSADDPFGTLAEAENASALGDAIVVHAGDGSGRGLTGGIVLQDGQVLCGTGGDCTIDGVLVSTETVEPTLGPVMAASYSTVRGIGAEVVDASNTSGVVIEDVSVIDAPEFAVAAYGAHDLIVRDVFVHNAHWEGLYFEDCGEVTVSRVAIRGTQLEGLYLYKPYGDWVIEDLTIEDADKDSVKIQQDGTDVPTTIAIRRATLYGIATSTKHGVHAQFRQDVTVPTHLELRNIEIADVKDEGVHLDVRNRRNGSGAVTMDLRSVSMRNFGSEGLLIDVREDAEVTVDVEGLDVVDTLGGPEAGVDVHVDNQASVTLRLVDSTVHAARHAVATRVNNTAELVCEISGSSFEGGDIDLWFDSSGQSTQLLTVHDTEMLGDGGMVLEVDSSNARLWADVRDNPSIGGFHIDTVDSANWALGLVHEPLVGTVADDTDLGVFGERGNTSGGGAPIVEVAGSIGFLMPEDVAIP